jgi:hypothetical protein
LFKIWLCPTGGTFKGYTTASNQGLLGAAIIETPVTDFTMRNIEEERPFVNLHGSSVDVTISSTVFAINGGTTSLKLIVRTNDSSPVKELTFFSDECKGFAASVGDIHFVATLLELPASEWDANQQKYLP